MSADDIRREAWQVEPRRDFKLVYSKAGGLVPMGECLCCGHIMALAVWKDEKTLGEVTHGVCAACLGASQPLRGSCSTERGCWCAASSSERTG